jgi:hypothetical protein
MDPDDLDLVHTDGVGPAVGYAASLLESIASVEGGDLATACEGMAALLRSLQPRPEPASPGDLAHLAALAIREAGEQSAAWGSAWIPVAAGNGDRLEPIRFAEMGEAIRAAANSGVLR